MELAFDLMRDSGIKFRVKPEGELTFVLFEFLFYVLFYFKTVSLLLFRVSLYYSFNSFICFISEHFIWSTRVVEVEHD